MIDHKLTSYITHTERTRCTPQYLLKDSDIIQYKLTEDKNFNDYFCIHVNSTLYIIKATIFFDKMERSARIEYSLRRNVPCYKALNVNFDEKVPPGFRAFVFAIMDSYRRKWDSENSLSVSSLISKMVNSNMSLKETISHMRTCQKELLLGIGIEDGGEKRFFKDYNYKTGEDWIKSRDR